METQAFPAHMADVPLVQEGPCPAWWGGCRLPGRPSWMLGSGKSEWRVRTQAGFSRTVGSCRRGLSDLAVESSGTSARCAFALMVPTWHVLSQPGKFHLSFRAQSSASYWLSHFCVCICSILDTGLGSGQAAGSETGKGPDYGQLILWGRRWARSKWTQEIISEWGTIL